MDHIGFENNEPATVAGKRAGNIGGMSVRTDL